MTGFESKRSAAQDKMELADAYASAVAATPNMPTPLERKLAVERIERARNALEAALEQQQAEPDRRALQAEGKHPAPCARHCEAKAFEIEIRSLKSQLKQQAEPVSQRSDGMPTSKTERDLRRMLCIARHGGSAYMDDGEASFCGDKYYRSIDYMRESIESIRQAWYDAGVKRLSGAQPEQQAEPVAETTHDYRFRYDKACYKCKSMYCPADCKDTTPPQCKELSASEILDMMPSTIPAEYDGPLMEFARAVEAKLKERNK